MKPHSGPEFFGDENYFAAYCRYRDAHDIPNELVEEPIFNEMIGDVAGMDIFDLGCGNGLYGRNLLERGATAYVGWDASQLMVDAACANLRHTVAVIEKRDIENAEFPLVNFDLTISRLTLHWIGNLAATFLKIFHALRPNGRFCFSMLHPIVTSCDVSRLRQLPYYVVHKYFDDNPRPTKWFDADVVWHHRTLEGIFRALTNAGFRVDDLRESRPKPELIPHYPLLQVLQNFPLILFVSASAR